MCLIPPKWCSWPPAHSFYLVNLLGEHVKLHYEKGIVGYLGGSVRETIFQSLFQLRADPATHRLGMVFHHTDGGTEIQLSPYAVCCVNCSTSPEDSPREEHGGTEGGFKWNILAETATLCLRKELWWPALKTFFRYFPEVIHNRILVLSSPESVPEIATALIQLTGDPHRAGHLVNAPENFSMSELNDVACSSMAPLVAYKNEMDLDLQKKLVMGIQASLVSDKSTSAVIATIGCALELPEAVSPMCRDLVRRLAELPSSPRIVIPMMELLSTIMRITSAHKHFTEKHFQHVMDVFVPCTNPEKFTTFIVAMGYHLLCRWFLSAPIKYRQGLGKYILRNMDTFSTKNSVAQKLDEQELADRSLGSEMRGTLVEFLNQYSFTDTPPLAGHNRVIEALMDRQGVSKSWIVRQRIFTVKTVVSPDSEGMEFLCSKCREHLRKGSVLGEFQQRKKSESVSSNPSEDFLVARRRHASAVQRKVTQGPPVSMLTSMDDSCICTSPKIDRPYIARGVRFNEPEEEVEEPSGLPICACWCQGYAIIDIRHCFGRTSWLIKISEAQLDSGNTELLRSALIRLGEGLGDAGRSGAGSQRKKRLTSSEFPRNLSDTVLVMNLDSELMGKGPEWERAEEALSRNSSISMKSGRSLLDPDDELGTHRRRSAHSSLNGLGGEWENEDRQASLDLGGEPLRESERDLDPSTPTSTGSSAYFSVRSSHNRREEDSSLPPTVRLRIDPAWVFTQLCAWSPGLGVCELPEKSGPLARSLRLLDMLRPEETHKIGVVYAGPRQQKEEEMLGNVYGSERYARFLEGMGELISLKDTDPQKTFLGGLSTDGSDGKFTYYWHDQITQVVFHVSSLMPNREKDPSFNKKRMHIGNDYVAICYNDTGREYRAGTISGELSYVVILVEPEDSHTLSIRLIAKDEISRWLTLKNVIISDEEAPLLCRQMAMRADLSAKIWWTQQNSPEHPYLSSSLERLREILKIRDKFDI